MTALSRLLITHSGDAQMQPVTIPAGRPDPRGELLTFHLSDAEREQAARFQAQLELHRNAPQKRRFA